ncbi:hypothetical protein SAMN05660860_03333 [Geoalkalibacter ferrihydriticus]|uniref:Uncharacterized protein n=1 Tax=Geoalkalibacter ferrihydriticus TaxID=392333 RepID=A0A1G9WX51_9BACT|nr:hypothetical protein SAMN05660860_03333 [Geoalkalibacter ferrihydriticus]
MERFELVFLDAPLAVIEFDKGPDDLANIMNGSEYVAINGLLF